MKRKRKEIRRNGQTYLVNLGKVKRRGKMLGGTLEVLAVLGRAKEKRDEALK